ncbi:TIM23 translocase complex subunit Tim50 [Schizosaccharomyces cryophilus OY26]|uniref:Mitochondrial import inner membrane translocase subunit TIM50 n=1 Tax=Schizosaccharomyces cryophilus (strain OY26 / ATCC MYA-4695 / CBS 11777 / NBRC 106824 / NRRL Y48691) TaxID=653667 RepID=S9VMQ9_SCHCR|nr:TIM23 translocase complex subunit Tim50 [Schizosaccharomyces cryophilus OY26]EPY49258.1 TIM23 translocase complex subunit Tim50 [Schizosaccharomyces cryophilus OY26]
MLKRSLISKSLRLANPRTFAPFVNRRFASEPAFSPEKQSTPKPEENKGKEGKSSLAQELLELNGSSEDPYSGGSDKGPEYVSSTMLRREKQARYAFWGFMGALGGGILYYGRKYTDDEKDLEKKFPAAGYSPMDWWTRVKARTKHFFAYYQEPAFEKLLPDPLPEPYNRPYTLVLDLDDLLIHAGWTREHGWRTAKRPGLDYFLGYLSMYYEIVIFTNQYLATAKPIVDKLDPYHVSISAVLTREHSKYENGKLIKDISYLNRPLSKVIMVDTNPDAWSKQPDNAIAMVPWKGNPKDRELVGLIPLLEFIAIMDIQDVRPVLKSYHGKNIPLEYARREEKLRSQLIADWLEKKKYSKASLFGGRPVSDQPPKLLIDIQRERQKAAYAEFKKYIDEHGPKMLEEERAREAEQKYSMFDMIFNGDKIQQQQLEQLQQAQAASASGSAN